MLTPVSAFFPASHPTLSHSLLRTSLMLANTGTPIPGLLYSSVQRREREQKKQKRATEEKEEVEKKRWERAGTNRNVLPVGNEFLRYLL